MKRLNIHIFLSIFLLTTASVSVLCILNPQRTQASTTVQIFLTSGTTWTVPTDWNNANNSIEVIGGGGGGTQSSGAGGGGGYSKVVNITLPLGASVTYAAGGSGAGVA